MGLEGKGRDGWYGTGGGEDGRGGERRGGRGRGERRVPKVTPSKNLRSATETREHSHTVRHCVVVLCDTHDTTILIVDTSRRYRRYLRDDTTAVYRSSKKYRETVKVS